MENEAAVVGHERELDVVADEVAGVVEDDALAVTLYALGEMGGVAVDDVDAGVDGGVGEFPKLRRLGLAHVRAPVLGEHDEAGAARFQLGDGGSDLGDGLSALVCDDAGTGLGRAGGELGHGVGGGEEADFLALHLDDHRSGGFGKVHPGARMRDARGVQRGDRIGEAFGAVVERVVVRLVDEAHAALREDGDAFRRSAEMIGLGVERHAAPGDAAFEIGENGIRLFQQRQCLAPEPGGIMPGQFRRDAASDHQIAEEDERERRHVRSADAIGHVRPRGDHGRGASLRLGA